MKILTFITRLLFVLCVPTLLISVSIAAGFNSQMLYEYGFNKYGVSQTTGLPPTELSRAAGALIRYFNSGDEYIDITVTRDGMPFQLFTREEAIHFKDVKDLVRLDYTVLLTSLVYFLAFVMGSFLWHRPRHRRALARSALHGCGVTLAVMLVLGAGAALDFNWLFLQFHFLAFTNPYWSAPGYMLLLFPGGFWYDAALICAALTAVPALLLAGASFVYLKRTPTVN